VGRQPWTVYGQLRTADAASVLPVGEVLTSLSVFAVLYTVLLVFALYFGSQIIAKRPNLTLEPPPGLATPVILPDRSAST
jgi:cytochrome d ubiquinol oxidase subunit I